MTASPRLPGGRSHGGDRRGLWARAARAGWPGLRALVLASTCAGWAASLPAQAHFDTAGWERLFDGRSLEGWTTRGGRYDGDARWTVEDGAITGRPGPGNSGGLLYTERELEDFAFACDVALTHPFDSGVFVRMVPPGGGKGAQVTLDVRPGGEVGAVYAEGFLQHDRESASLWREGWNRVEVLCTGHPMRLRAWLNGTPTTDWQLDDASGWAPRGRIGLQVHGGIDPDGVARFRDLWVRVVPRVDAALFDVDARGLLAPTPAARELGWRDLLAGGLEAWEPVGGTSGFALESGELVLHTDGDAAYLRTREDFRDIELRLDFEIAPMANSGVFLRGGRGDPHPASSGCEIQILDDFAWERVTGDRLRPWQHTGSLYHSVASDPRSWRPPGTWNTLEILWRGPRLRVALNGDEQFDVDVREVDTHGWPAFSERARAGFVGLQRHAPPHVEGERFARFRNLMLRVLEPPGETR